MVHAFAAAFFESNLPFTMKSFRWAQYGTAGTESDQTRTSIRVTYFLTYYCSKAEYGNALRGTPV